MRAGVALWLVASLAGCGRACKNDHPYVPYSIGDADAADAGEDGPLAAAPEEGGAPEVEGSPAPAGATRWSLDGLELSAPPDRAFVLGVARDVDGDGSKDAVAIVRSTKEPTSPDEIVFYKGGARGVDAAATVARAPGPAPDEDAGCARIARLAKVGQKSIFAELGATCAPPVAASRWIAIVSFDRGARVHFSASVLDPPNAAKLTVDADASDRDGDGIDDVGLRVTIDAPSAPFEPMPRASAKLVWLDRPAGLSRPPDEPDASLRALAQGATAKAARAKDAPLVPATVHQVRALYGAICAEGGAARLVKTSVGNGQIACGASRALEEAGFALVRAYATLGDAARAAAALERAQLPPATKTAARLTEAQAWLAQAAPVVPTAQQLRAVAAVPQIERGTAPAWGALAFEPSGKLLVRTIAGAVRVDPVNGDEVEASEAPSWKMHVVSPDGGMRFTEAYAACDGATIRAMFVPTGFVHDLEPLEVLVPVAPPLGARCAGGKGEPARVLPIAWGPRGLEAVVQGEPVLFAAPLGKAALAAASLDQPVTLGAPRSPSGKLTVVPTSQGIVVRGAKTRMLRAKELEGGYGELQSCAVNDDGTAVACVRGGRAFVGIWEAP